MEASVDTIVISCMDRRLSHYLDQKYNNGCTLFLRNAGANVKTLLDSVKQICTEEKIKRIVVAPHTDCGAMGYVYKSLNEEITPDPSIDSALISQFKGISFSSRANLEEQNSYIQKTALKSIASSTGSELSTNLIKMEMLDIPKDEGKHILTITEPSTTFYYDMLNRYKEEYVGLYSSYFIQGTNINDLFPDISIATGALHIDDVRFISQDAMQDKKFAEIVKTLKNEKFMAHAKLALLKHDA